MSPHKQKIACLTMAATLTLGTIMPLGNAYATDGLFDDTTSVVEGVNYEEIYRALDAALADSSASDVVLKAVEQVDKELPDAMTYRSLWLAMHEMNGAGIPRYGKTIYGSGEILNGRYFYGEGGPFISSDRALLSIALDVVEDQLTPPEGFTKDDYIFISPAFATYNGSISKLVEITNMPETVSNWVGGPDWTVILWEDARADKTFHELITGAEALDAYNTNSGFHELVELAKTLESSAIAIAKSDLTKLGIAYPENAGVAELNSIFEHNESIQAYSRYLAQRYHGAMNEVIYRKCHVDHEEIALCHEANTNFFLSQPETRAYGKGAEAAGGNNEASDDYGSDESLRESGAQLIAAATQLKSDFLANSDMTTGDKKPTEQSVDSPKAEADSKAPKAPKAGVLGSEISANIVKYSAIAIAVAAAVAGIVRLAKLYFFSPLKRRK